MTESYEPQVGDFIAEVLYTDTRVYEVVGRTAQTIRVRSCKRGEVVKKENRDGNPWPCVWNAAEVDEAAPVRTLRRTKDGIYRTHRSANWLRPATVIEGVPCFYTDYRE